MERTKDNKAYRPLVTIIIVNYNSMANKTIVLESINGILNLNYRPLEIIFVDNGSNDGSFEFIKDIVEKLVPKDITVKFLKLSKNYGFAIANNIAFTIRNKEAKYIALINNDLIPEADSLKKLIDFLEEKDNVGGAQGLILNWDGSKVDSAGIFVTNFWYTHFYGRNVKASNKMFVSYISGAYSVYRVDSLLKCGDLFFPYFFMCGEDVELGLRLWCSDFKIVYVPIVAGRHFGSATIKRFHVMEYFSWRNIIPIIMAYDRFYLLKLLEKFVSYLIATCVKRNKLILRAFIDGIFLGFVLKKWIKKLNCKKEPIYPVMKISIFKLYSLIFKAYIRYKSQFSGLSSIAISEILKKYFNKLNSH
jgi:GT2 family glycosyltransferase